MAVKKYIETINVKNLIRKTTIVFPIILLGLSCQSQNQEDFKINTTYKFLTFIENRNDDSVRALLGFALKDIGKNNELFEFDMAKASDIIKQYGIPERSKFSFEKDTANFMKYTYVNVPIPVKVSPKNKLLKATIRLIFLDELGDNKIANYEIETEYRKSIIQPF